jgi:hypothetical protein
MVFSNESGSACVAHEVAFYSNPWMSGLIWLALLDSHLPHTTKMKEKLGSGRERRSLHQ